MLDIQLIPVLKTNYIFLLTDQQTGINAVVDPGVAPPVIDVIEETVGKLDYILNTHHHWDHVNGIPALKKKYNCKVIGPRAELERVPVIDIPLDDGDTFELGAENIKAIMVPGHTTGHMAFWCQDSDALFCGDALFSMTCGYMFEGTPEMMWESMKKIKQLPDSTRIYCAHEYTSRGVKFAQSIEGDNPAIKDYAKEVRKLRAKKKSTIPALLGIEKAGNPFLRADVPEFQAAMGMKGADPIEVFAATHKQRDIFNENNP